jgi:transcriptional regulator with XRE-family HTH domain
MLTRIQRIIDEKGLSISAFADEIGVNKPSMAHTMSGRNRPSLDFITKILERYTEISSEWLIFGHGLMLKSNAPIQQVLFDTMPISFEDQKIARPETSISPDNNRSNGIVSLDVIPNHLKTNEDERKISKILIFFSDSTFETFIPESMTKK